MYRLLITLASFIVSLSAFAHEGHNHSSSMASLVHLLWLAPLLLAVAILGVYFKRRLSSDKNN